MGGWEVYNVRSGHLNATFGGEDMGSMAQTGLLLVPSDALGHTWALPGVLGAGQGLPPESGPEDLNVVCGGACKILFHAPSDCPISSASPSTKVDASGHLPWSTCGAVGPRGQPHTQAGPGS